jgi:hypothetical protein
VTHNEHTHPPEWWREQERIVAAVSGEPMTSQPDKGAQMERACYRCGTRESFWLTKPCNFGVHIAYTHAAEPKESAQTELPPIPEPSTNYVNVSKWNLACRERQLREALATIRQKDEEIHELRSCVKVCREIEKHRLELIAALKQKDDKGVQ